MKLVEKFCAAFTAALILSIPYFAFAAPGQWLLQTGGGASGGGGGGITLVNHSAGCQTPYAGATVLTLTCTITSTTAGNFLTVYGSWCEGQSCISGNSHSISSIIACAGSGPCTSGDTCVQTPSALAHVNLQGSGDLYQDIWYCVLSAGDTAVTMTIAGTTANFLTVQTQEWSGVNTSSPVDGTAGTFSSATQTTSGSCQLAAATTQTNSLVLAVLSFGTSGTGTVSAPFTELDKNNTGNTFGDAYYIDPNTDRPTVSYTQANHERLCSIAAFKHS